MEDQILNSMRDFEAANPWRVRRLRHEQRSLVMAALRQIKKFPLPARPSYNILSECFSAGETELKRLAALGTKDAWLTLLRRFPDSDDGALLGTISAVLVSFAPLTGDVPLELERDDGRWNLRIPLTREDIEQVYRFWFTAAVVIEIGRNRRVVGKGGRIALWDTESIRLSYADGLYDAIEEYERRRDRTGLFSREGFAAEFGLAESGIGFPGLMTFKRPQRTYVPGRDIWLVSRYLFGIFELKPLERIFRSYQASIEASLGITVDAILHVFVALSELIRISSHIPSWDSADEFPSYHPDDGTSDYQKRLSFTFNLGIRGYLRFPRNSLVKSLSTVLTPWAPDQEIARRHSENFISVFAGDRWAGTSIDLNDLVCVPFVHPSHDDGIYVDLKLVPQFLLSIVNAAKRYLRNLHGDLFPLTLREMILERFPGVGVEIGRAVLLASSRKSDIDLLVSFEGRLIAIECKAYGKSAGYMRGGPDDVSSRRGQVKGAVKQIQRNVENLTNEIRSGKTEFLKDTIVEWLVCFPSQEFLLPLNEFGMISDTVPRVITPEELLDYLKDISHHVGAPTGGP